MAVGALEDLTAQMVLTQISVVPGYSWGVLVQSFQVDLEICVFNSNFHI